MKNYDAPRPSKQFFVYTLGHPNGYIFYVGKGSGNRLQAHFTEARKGTCRCPKCLCIQKIWKEKLDVKIEYVFETDSEREALEQESEWIMAIGRNHPLCNWQGNLTDRMPRKPQQAVGLTLAEYKEHLGRYGLSRRELENYIQEWGMLRANRLEEQWRKARRRHEYDRAKALEEEIDDINIATGNVWQHRLEM